ncbi:uncharacterized protein LACBIDRAFT_306627 [Laccaria bicolor S238N-H82]|uniref:Predicted protein n=1 Tax=Laccaria bicolor (strain S238N-H82 / ATCC MYA-4686) TaxID=486041 RepID=B0DNG6_LACBS|nr:uncharacterized protein LACBIDRAFT_306627 [Laccaria bicolor S238N-H82]EDR03936.1 predicted protein [Laccaria bicolor S238N-H82]|eukprot:XP_001885504.1 predicted protein [Laccaria bicolor S238N-H82]
MGESILKQTGWHVTFIVGGPEPRQNGKIMTYMLNCGRTMKDEDYEGFLGEDAYEEHIIAPFDDFLHEAFTPEARLERSLTSKSETPESAGGEGIEEVNDKHDSNAVDGEAHIDKEAPKKGGKSEYEHSRETNIARNKELLRQVEERFPMEPLAKADKTNGRGPENKVKRKEKVHQEPTRSSARIQGQGPGDVPETTTTEPAANEGTSPSITVPIQSSGTVGNVAEANLTRSISTPAEIENDVTASTSDHVNASPSNHIDASPSALVDSAHTSSDDFGASPPATGVGPLVEPTPSFKPAHTSDDFGGSPPAIGVGPLIKPTPSASSIASESETPAMYKVSTSTQPSTPTSTVSQMDVDSDIRDTTDTGTPLPAWLHNVNMSDYLHGVSKEKAWQDLITSLFKFKALNPTTGVHINFVM